MAVDDPDGVIGLLGTGAVLALAYGITVFGRRTATGRRWAAVVARWWLPPARQWEHAATSGDLSELRRLHSSGVSVDVANDEGNTALHHAYYGARADAVALLLELGADTDRRNAEGLRAWQMAQVADAERTIERAVLLIEPNGRWRDPALARRLYDDLAYETSAVYNCAITRAVMRDDDERSKTLCLAVKLGRPGSENALGDALMAHGSWLMAEAYLNSGHPDLAFWARRWVRTRGGFSYRTLGGRRTVPPRATWGQF